MVRMNRFDLYTACAQAPEQLVAVLRAIHGNDPIVLGEDFSGAARLSAAWLASVPGGRAVAVDHDADAIGLIEPRDGLVVLHGDVIDAVDCRIHAADVVHAGNFSIGEWHRRTQLMNYLRHARRRLGDGGVFACDVYGGETAFACGSVIQECLGPGGEVITYTWEQRRADPLTGLVENVMHFEVTDPDGRSESHRDAFTYRWRLWSIAELRDAMHASGFARVDVYPKIPDAMDGDGNAFVEPFSGDDLDADYDVLVIGRGR